MRLTVNGVEQEISSPPLTALLHVLREELEITSPKAGCQQGGCGTCTVLVDGEPRRSCLTPVAVVDGAAITTLEGLGEAEALSPVQAAFHNRYAAVGHVTGRTQYVDDVRVGRTRWVKALRSPHHRAAITKLDTAKAEALKGVHAIITAADVPRNVYGHLEGLGVPGDEPLLAD